MSCLGPACVGGETVEQSSFNQDIPYVSKVQYDYCEAEKKPPGGWTEAMMDQYPADEYHWKFDPIGHNPTAMISALSVIYKDSEWDWGSAYEAQYPIEITKEVQKRQRTVAVINPDGSLSYKTEYYDYVIMSGYTYNLEYRNGVHQFWSGLVGGGQLEQQQYVFQFETGGNMASLLVPDADTANVGDRLSFKSYEADYAVGGNVHAPTDATIENVTGKSVTFHFYQDYYMNYDNMEAIDVQVGQQVNRGQKIGTAGSVEITAWTNVNGRMEQLMPFYLFDRGKQASEGFELRSPFYSNPKINGEELNIQNGEFVWPLDGYTKITSKFGKRISPITGKDEWHNGIDIQAPKGTPIKAPKDGVVEQAGFHKSYGYYIKIHHTGTNYYTIYAHCSQLIARRGDVVKTGDTIARVGSTGDSTGNHLHFEIRFGPRFKDAVDPMFWFKKKP